MSGMTPERLAEIRAETLRDYAAHESGIYLSNPLVLHRFELLAEVDRLRAQVDLAPGDYWMTSIGDGRGRAIVTYQGRLLVEQFPDSEGRVLWSDLTDVYRSSTSWRFEPRAAMASGDEVQP